MKKFFMMFVMAIMTIVCVNAQTTYEGTKFTDNTYFRLEGGATALTHPRCLGYENWGHSIQAVIGAEAGKWITPKFGVAFEGDFGIRNGSKTGVFNYQMIVPADGAAAAYLKKAPRFNYINVTGLVKFNMSNIVAGFNPDRKWEFVMATGPMWIHGFPGKDYTNDFGVKFKAEVNYNLTDRIQFNLIPEFNYNLTGLYSYGTQEHPRFDSRNSWYALKLGATYKFGKQFTACPYKYTQADVDALNAEINDLRARQPEVVEKVVEKVVYQTKNDVNEYVVSFDYGSAVLDNAAKATLDKVTGEVTLVTGEASTPGSKEYNAKLSANRAAAVAKYLKDRGIKVNEVRGLGETGRQIATVKIK